MTTHRNGGKFSKLKENHHIFFRKNGACIVQIQNNGQKISRSFNDIETARKWRDETIAAIPLPIVKFEPRVKVYQGTVKKIKTSDPKAYTPIEPINVGPTIVSWT